MSADPSLAAIAANQAPDLGAMAHLRRAGRVDQAAGPWSALVAAQCSRRLEGICVLMPDPDTGRLRLTASSPADRRPTDAMIVAADSAMKAAQPILVPATAASPLAIAAHPLLIEGVARGVVGLEARGSSRADLIADLQHVQWGAAWLRDLIRAEDTAEEAAHHVRAVAALNAVVTVAERPDFLSAAMAAVTDLAARFDCDRVALGLRRFRRTRIMALSHAAQFSRRMKLLRDLEQAQDEAVDQRSTVLWPMSDGDDPVINKAHETYATAHGAGMVYSVPLWSRDRFIGALTFERPASRPFDQDALDILEAVTTVLAPIIEEKRLNDRWLITRAGLVAGRHLRRLLGPNYLDRKLAVLGVIAVAAFLGLARTTDRVSADAIVKGAVEQSVVAPFEGFVAEADVRAGQLVTQGQVLARLDDRDLALERLRLETLRQKNQLEYDRAVAQRDRAGALILQTQIAQADAQIELVEEQRGRTILTAPFDGIVISGDLSQSIGSTVTRGEEMFVVAPRDSYRIDIEVEDRRIDDVQPGQTGFLRVTALPDQSFAITVKRITPVASYGGGKTTFRVEAELDKAALGPGIPRDLLPGMQGAARIDIGDALLAEVWARPLIDRSRLLLWRYWPG